MRIRLDVELGIGAAAEPQAPRDVLKTHARFPPVLGWKARAGIAHSDAESAVRLEARFEPQQPAARLGRDAVLDGVFDQWLNRENRNRNRERLRFNVDFNTQLFAQAETLDFQVRFHDVQLFLERQERLPGFEEIAENVRQIQNGFPCALGLARNDAVQRVQRIEQEMGMDLRLQRAQFGLRNQAAHLGFAVLLHLLDHLPCRASQRLQILAQIAPSAGAAPE